ncbi:MAG: NAD(P)-dependent oxidoreductase [Solirubrobacterales bacterium]|nr:NAD(P)-dependent oxidoreductase [Solirubrobacterales bacterium]
MSGAVGGSARRLGIIGLGEAGGAIASGLHEARGEPIPGFDLRNDDPSFSQRIADQGVAPCGSIAELTRQCDVLVCLTSAKVAVDTAVAVAAHLGVSDIYVDLNSASPGTKAAAAEIVERAGARFIDGAVMAAVPPKRHRVPILLSGAGAGAAAATLTRLGLNVEAIGDTPGQASAVKMLRSSVLKGVNALVLECLQAAAAYGVTDRVLASIDNSMPFDDWRALANYTLSRETVHGQRRAEELRQAAATIRAAGVEPLVAEAGARRIQAFMDEPAGKPLAASMRDSDGGADLVARLTDLVLAGD